MTSIQKAMPKVSETVSDDVALASVRWLVKELNSASTPEARSLARSDGLYYAYCAALEQARLLAMYALQLGTRLDDAEARVALLRNLKVREKQLLRDEAGRLTGLQEFEV